MTNQSDPKPDQLVEDLLALPTINKPLLFDIEELVKYIRQREAEAREDELEKLANLYSPDIAIAKGDLHETIEDLIKELKQKQKDT